MPGRRAAAIGLAALSLAGTVVLRRHRGRGRMRVDLYFDDGSMLSLGEDAPETLAVLPAALDVLAAA